MLSDGLGEKRRVLEPCMRCVRSCEDWAGGRASLAVRAAAEHGVLEERVAARVLAAVLVRLVLTALDETQT